MMQNQTAGFSEEGLKGIQVAPNPIAHTKARKGKPIMHYNMPFIFKALQMTSIPLLKLDVIQQGT